MNPEINHKMCSKSGIGAALCLLGLGGCVFGPESAGPGGDDPSAAMTPAAALRTRMDGGFGNSRNGRGSHCDPGTDAGGTGSRVLLSEPWDLFDSEVWRGDGDQEVSGGRFTARVDAPSAAADWVPGEVAHLDGGRTLRFANTLAADRDFATSWRQALFFVSGDEDSSFRNYAFVYVRYSGAEQAVTLESFGASGGVEFDQMVDAPWVAADGAPLGLEIRIRENGYAVLVDGALADSVALGEALRGITAFEVGVQRGPKGAAGLIEETVISVDSAKAPGLPEPRAHCRRRAVGRAEGRARAHSLWESLSHGARAGRGLEALSRRDR